MINEQLKETIYIGVSIWLVSLLIGFITMFAITGNKYIAKIDIETNYTNRMKMTKELYRFDKNGVDTVTGSDIVDLMLKYDRNFEYTIVDGVQTISFNLLEETLGSTIWEQDFLNNYFVAGNYKFKSKVIDIEGIIHIILEKGV